MTESPCLMLTILLVCRSVAVFAAPGSKRQRPPSASEPGKVRRTGVGTGIGLIQEVEAECTLSTPRDGPPDSFATGTLISHVNRRKAKNECRVAQALRLLDLIPYYSDNASSSPHEENF